MQRKWIMGLLAGAARACVLGNPIRPVSAEDQPNIAEMVKNAKTPADHLALAARYDKLAADAQAQAPSYRTMAETYKGSASSKGVGGQPPWWGTVRPREELRRASEGIQGDGGGAPADGQVAGTLSALAGAPRSGSCETTGRRAVPRG
jgi:hypothetical protein